MRNEEDSISPSFLPSQLAVGKGSVKCFKDIRFLFSINSQTGETDRYRNIKYKVVCTKRERITKGQECKAGEGKDTGSRAWSLPSCLIFQKLHPSEPHFSQG